MAVNGLLVLVFVQIQVFGFDKGRSGFHIQTARIVFKAHAQITNLHLLLEQIHLVHEQDDRGIKEPSAVANFIKEQHAFTHTVGGVIFVALLIVFTQTGHDY